VGGQRAGTSACSGRDSAPDNAVRAMAAMLLTECECLGLLLQSFRGCCQKHGEACFLLLQLVF
jgi:hypothetical protein